MSAFKDCTQETPQTQTIHFVISDGPHFNATTGEYDIYIGGEIRSYHGGTYPQAMQAYHGILRADTALALAELGHVSGQDNGDWFACGCGRVLDAGDSCPDCIPWNGEPVHCGDPEADDYGLEGVA